MYFQKLYNKGITAMEAAHKRTIQIMQENHDKELKQLLSEKEQALAEETKVNYCQFCFQSLRENLKHRN